VNSIGNAVDTFPIQPGSLATNAESLKPISFTNSVLKAHGYNNLSGISDLQFNIFFQKKCVKQE